MAKSVGPVDKATIVVQDINVTSQYLSDGKRRIDFVLVFHKNQASSRDLEIYFSNLENASLVIEVQESQAIKNYIFALIHGTDDALNHFSKFFELDLVMHNPTYIWYTNRLGPPCIYDDITNPVLGSDVYWRATETVAAFRPKTYTTAERSLIVSMIMAYTLVGNEDTDDKNGKEYGYSYLILRKILVDAFSLHDGTWRWKKDGALNDRQLLYKFWSNIFRIHKQQPLHVIDKYFGTEVGFYYAYLEFLNNMLVPLAVLGIIFFCIGIVLIFIGHEYSEFCSSEIPICPHCADLDNCPSTILKDHCRFKFINMLFDNTACSMFTIVTVIWSFIYVVLWRRHQSTLQMRFNVIRMKYDTRTRPEFAKKASVMKISKFTQNQISDVPLIFKVFGYSFTYISIIIIWSIMGLFAYIQNLFRNFIQLITSFSAARMYTMISLTASLINWGIVLFVFSPFLLRFAISLTNYEFHRTEIKYTDSVVYKLVLISIPEFYGILIYLAIVKGNLFTFSSDALRWSALGAIPADTCSPAGCIADVSIQLLVILVSDTIFAVFKSFFKAYFWYLWRKGRYKMLKLGKNAYQNMYRWEKDFVKMSVGKYALLLDYRDILLRYGFVTFFSAACPLAPFFVLVYGLIKIRTDAYKMVIMNRKKVGAKVISIGAWNNVLHFFTIGGTITNLLIVTFCSSYIPRLYYISNHGSLKGFVKDSFAPFNTKKYLDFQEYESTDDNLPEICYQRGYTFNSTSLHDGSVKYWHQLTAQIAFILIAEHILLLIALLMYTTVPSKSQSVILYLEEENRELKQTRLATLDKESARHANIIT